jgi:murein DD-endopeptidase MepM/ murein hydrolase activator NlpD
MLAVRAILVLVAVLSSGAPAAAAVPVDPARPALEPTLTGYERPVAAPLVLDPALLPGATRAYRAGIHEGIDFRAPYGMPVHAARGGIVVRVDADYEEWSAAERAAAFAAAIRDGGTSPDVLDRIRGRQVWIDHGDGVVTRYAHLSRVAGLHVGEAVAAGDVIGYVGASGYPEGGPHLHFEIRVGDGYLGEGLAPESVVQLVSEAFSVRTRAARGRLF